jgi:ABC-type phosphate transport system substrate-binding protein
MRCLRLVSLFGCLLGASLPAMAASGIVIIAHRDSPLQALTPREVSDLYLGRMRSLPADASSLLALYDHPSDHALRARFFHELNGMTLKQLNAYWARLRFSGAVLPPDTLPNSRAVVEAVGKNRVAIGYVDASAVDNSVKVLLRLPAQVD